MLSDPFENPPQRQYHLERGRKYRQKSANETKDEHCPTQGHIRQSFRFCLHTYFPICFIFDKARD
jgi:hypothetical protein